jgi:hypothetical protein
VANLNHEVAEWRSKPFPAGSSNDAVDELHADLVLIDSWVADSVIPFVQEGRHTPAAVDVLGAIDRLQEQIAQLMSITASDTRLSLENYQAYAECLSGVYRAFLEERP